MGEAKVLNNLELRPDDKCVIVSVNPKIYPLEVIYAAAHVFTEKSFVIIDGDPQQEVIVELKPKDAKDIEELGRDFNNELIVHAAGRLRPIHDTMETALENGQEISCESDESYINDPLGIARPWEEVYGKGRDQQG